MITREELEALEAVAEQHTFNKLAYFKPYPKQEEFFNLSAIKKELLLMAGNRVGKTEAGAAKAAYHLTGRYPKDWKGAKWDGPTRGWVAGETGKDVRDIQQKKLCGEPGVASLFGSGYIPRECFVDKPTLARGASDAYDSIQVQHVSGGISIARFKSYEQGRESFQGDDLHWIWWDEEPPIDVYSEGLVRLAPTTQNPAGGKSWMTFTPLKGRSAVVLRFMDQPDINRAVVSMTIEDAEHFTPEQRRQQIASYEPHEREARARGVPILGSGRIFRVTELSIVEPQLTEIPPYWVKLWGVDAGIAHPFAATLILWDRDNDIVHIHHSFKIKDQTPLQHAVPMKRIGINVPVAWPQDAGQRDKGSLKPLFMQYKEQGLIMLHDHATWPDGSVSLEAGVSEMIDRMATGRLKVASQLTGWLEEFRFYHRKDGQIVKLQDDELSATRVALMMKRFARPVPLGDRKGVSKRRGEGIAKGLDFDVFG